MVLLHYFRVTFYVQSSTIVNVKSFLLMLNLSAANTSVNKMGFNTFVLFNIFNYCSLRHIMNLHFTVLIHFDEY